MRKPNQRPMRWGVKGQATTELAIMGSVILMALLFLAQQGLMYNARQGLEMYTFRQALQKAKDTKRGIDLTVMREVPSPSLFAGLSRQRIMASSSVEMSPFDLWIAEVDTNDECDDNDTAEEAYRQGHFSSYQLLQVGDGMIQNGYFIRVPPTLIKITEKKELEEWVRELYNLIFNGSLPTTPKWVWTNSSIRELDAQAYPESGYVPARPSIYEHEMTTTDGRINGEFVRFAKKKLTMREIIPIRVTFEPEGRIKQNHLDNDWEDKIESEKDIGIRAIPQDSIIYLGETVSKEKSIATPHAAR